MKVRIRSGNNAGQVVDLPGTEAENAIATGYAEACLEEAPAPAAAAAEPAEEEPAAEADEADSEPQGKRSRRR